MNLTNFYTNTFGTTQLWGLDVGFYIAMLAVVIIVILENLVFWNMKRRPVWVDSLLFAIKNDGDLETVEKAYDSTLAEGSLSRNTDIYLEEGLKNQTHDEVIRFLFRTFSFTEETLQDRKTMLLALENSNPEITRLFLDNCKE